MTPPWRRTTYSIIQETWKATVRCFVHGGWIRKTRNKHGAVADLLNRRNKCTAKYFPGVPSKDRLKIRTLAYIVPWYKLCLSDTHIQTAQNIVLIVQGSRNRKINLLAVSRASISYIPGTRDKGYSHIQEQKKLLIISSEQCPVSRLARTPQPQEFFVRSSGHHSKLQATIMSKRQQ